MFVELLDSILKTLAVYREAAELYIRVTRADRILLIRAFVEGKEILTKPEEKMQLTDIQKATFVINPTDIVDVKGNPAPVQDGSFAWASSDPTILTATPSADGKSCDVVAVGPIGHAQLTVTADADLGDGVTTISGVKEIDVVASQAVAINIGDVTPVDQ